MKTIPHLFSLEFLFRALEKVSVKVNSLTTPPLPGPLADLVLTQKRFSTCLPEETNPSQSFQKISQECLFTTNSGHTSNSTHKEMAWCHKSSNLPTEKTRKSLSISPLKATCLIRIEVNIWIHPWRSRLQTFHRTTLPFPSVNHKEMAWYHKST